MIIHNVAEIRYDKDAGHNDVIAVIKVTKSLGQPDEQWIYIPLNCTIMVMDTDIIKVEQ